MFLSDQAATTDAIFYSYWQLSIFKAVSSQKLNAVARIVVSNLFDTLQKIQFDEYSTTLSRQFCYRTLPGYTWNILVLQSLQRQKQYSIE